MSVIITLTAEQKDKARAKLAANMKAARKSFLLDNVDYVTPTFTSDDVAVSVAFDGDANAIIRSRQEALGAGLALLLTKTEKGVDPSLKYTVRPWLGAKRFHFDGSVRVMGYQSPLDVEEPLNSFVDDAGDTFRVLRSIGLLVLLDEAEIDAFVTEVDPDAGLYWQLFF